MELDKKSKYKIKADDILINIDEISTENNTFSKNIEKKDKKNEDFPNTNKKFGRQYNNKSENSHQQKRCSFCNMLVSANILIMHQDSHPSKILDWLYLGSYNNALNKKELLSLNIKYILNCAIECKNLYSDEFIYKQISISDKSGTKLKTYFNEVFKFIDEAFQNNLNLFVHCQMGKSRSVSFLIAYLMKLMKMKFDDAYLYVKRIRRMAFPNIGFMRELKEYEKELFP